MALFEYFPNYIWNLSLAIALESGAPIGEILDIAGPVKNAANGGADAGTQEFLRQWVTKANTLIGLAAELYLGLVTLQRGRAGRAAAARGP